MDDSGLGKWILDKLGNMDDKLEQVRIEQAKIHKSVSVHEQLDSERQQEIKDMNHTLNKYFDQQTKRLDHYDAQLKHQVGRVDAVEKQQNHLDNAVAPIVKSYNEQQIIKKNKSDGFSKTKKIIVMIGTIIGAVAGVFTVLRYF